MTTSPAREGSWPSAATRPVVLLGWPVHHSLSPPIHNAAFAEMGLDLVYLALPVRPEDLPVVVPALGPAGVVGANVTVPHKREVGRYVDVVTPEAELVGAVNTLTWTEDGVMGDNTDAVGLADAVLAEGAGAAGQRWVVLGTGGAARAVAVAAGRLGCALTVVARRVDAADDLADLARRAGAPSADAVDVADEVATRRAIAAARTILNATPLGMTGERLPAPFHAVTAGQHAYDLVYNPRREVVSGADGPETPVRTPFLSDAAAAGAGAHDGLGMLVGQAAASFRRWTGQDAPRATMVDTAREIVSRAVGE